ncbi:MAG: hypothetical protein DMG06_21805 [Acidobacteria bacterium]|nr:MAG: hypothetical protein DMG06_21805 [Acidobacteriota bacterium]
MTTRFRLALVGAGLITQEAHLPAALVSDKVEVAALIDPVVERARSLARSYGISPRIAESVTEAFGYIDGAVIATPNHTHKDIAVACLEAGVATLIEKPLASSLADGEAIVAAAQKTGAPVAVGYSTRFRDNIVLLKDLLAQSYFGQIRRFLHQFGTAGGWAPLSAYNLKRDASGGGVLVVTGTHFLDRMLHFWGYPSRVALEDDSLGGPEANCQAHFHYTQGFDGMARYSKTFRLPGGTAIETDRGVVLLRDTDEAEIVFYPRESQNVAQVIQRRERPAAAPSVFQLQIEDFVDACLTHQSPRVDASQGLLSLKLLDDLYQHRSSYNQDWYRASKGPNHKLAEIACV